MVHCLLFVITRCTSAPSPSSSYFFLICRTYGGKKHLRPSLLVTTKQYYAGFPVSLHHSGAAKSMSYGLTITEALRYVAARLQVQLFCGVCPFVIIHTDMHN
jgi:hypothetical protein